MLASSEVAGMQVWRGPHGEEVMRPTQLPADEAPGLRAPPTRPFTGLPGPKQASETTEHPLWLWLAAATAGLLLLEWLGYLRRRTL